MGGEGG